MRIQWLSLALLLLAGPATGATYDRVTVNAHYDDSAQVVTAHMSMLLSDLSPDEEALHLRLLANARCDEEDTAGCGFLFDSLLINGADRLDQAEIVATDLRLPLPYEGLTDKELAIDAYYQLYLPELGDRFGYSRNRVLLEGWIPVPAPRDDSGWIIVDYSNRWTEPVGDYFSFNVTLTAPPDYTIMAPNMELLRDNDSVQTVNITLAHAGHVAVALGRNFDRADTTIALIDGSECTLTTFYPPDLAFIVDSVQHWTAITLQYMSDVVGEPYPHDQYVTVLDGLPGGGGLEQPQMTWISRPREKQAVSFPKIVVLHEAIHQWFYYLIPSHQADHPWMDESITEYFTLRILEEVASPNTGNFVNLFGWHGDYQAFDRVAASNAFPRYTCRGAASAYQRNYFNSIYAKGSDVVATLDNLMREDGNAFWAEYYTRQYLRRPSESDFFELAEQYLPGTAPGRAEYLLSIMSRPDYSVVAIETGEPDGDSGSGGRQSEITVLFEQPVPFPLTLRLVQEDGVVRDTILTPTPGQHVIEIKSQSPVVQAIVDPEAVYTIDANYLNNSWSVDPVNSSDFRLFSGLTFLVESLYSMLWGW